MAKRSAAMLGENMPPLGRAELGHATQLTDGTTDADGKVRPCN